MFIYGLSDSVWQAVNVQYENLPHVCVLDEITQKDVNKRGKKLKCEESCEPRTQYRDTGKRRKEEQVKL